MVGRLTGLKFVAVRQTKWAKSPDPVELSEYAMDLPRGEAEANRRT